MNDVIVKALAYDKSVRVYAVSTTNALNEIGTRLNYFPSALDAMGRVLSMGAMMGSMLKLEETLTLKVEGDGPIGKIIVDADAHGHVRGYCDNPHCEGRVVESLTHFASRNMMNIDGLGERNVENLHSLGLIHTVADIYKLYLHKEQLEQIEGMGELSVRKLLNAIEKSKSNSLERLLFALGINEVGEKTAKIIARRFKTLDALMSASLETLTSIKDIGDATAQSIVDYFSDLFNAQLIEELRESGLNFSFIDEYAASFKETIFNGANVVITGTLSSMSRKEATNLLESLGANVGSSVSKNTNYLICGVEAGSKLDKANKLGVSVISEEQFNEMIK